MVYKNTENSRDHIAPIHPKFGKFSVEVNFLLLTDNKHCLYSIVTPPSGEKRDFIRIATIWHVKERGTLMGRLDNKVVLLTGASSGIGKQTAIRFAQEGAKLTICARRAVQLEETAKLCEVEGAEVIAYPCDLNNYDDLVKMVALTIERFGKIDVLVNNAVKGDMPHPLMEYTTEDLRQSVETNFIAPWHLMRLCYPHMKENGGGSIVNICSTAGTMGLEGFVCYASTKEALRGLSRVAAHEWGKDNIRVNVLNPSAITDSLHAMHLENPEKTQPIFDMMADIAALKRVGDAYVDVAPAILFLASDDSQFMTGQTLNVEGGGFIVP